MNKVAYEKVKFIEKVMVELNNDDCWSSEEEELNFGGTMNV